MKVKTISPRQKLRLEEQEKLILKYFKPFQRVKALDLGTEFGLTGASIRKCLDNAHITGVEVHEETFNEVSKTHGQVYNELVQDEALNFLTEVEGKFDLIVAAEIIEHFPKEKGFQLLQLLKMKAKVVIVTAPIGFKRQGEIYNNPYQRHLSGWEAFELVENGFEIHGLFPQGYTLGIYCWDKGHQWLL